MNWAERMREAVKELSTAADLNAYFEGADDVRNRLNKATKNVEALIVEAEAYLPLPR